MLSSSLDCFFVFVIIEDVECDGWDKLLAKVLGKALTINKL